MKGKCIYCGEPIEQMAGLRLWLHSGVSLLCEQTTGFLEARPSPDGTAWIGEEREVEQENRDSWILRAAEKFRSWKRGYDRALIEGCGIPRNEKDIQAPESCGPEGCPISRQPEESTKQLKPLGHSLFPDENNSQKCDEKNC